MKCFRREVGAPAKLNKYLKDFNLPKPSAKILFPK